MAVPVERERGEESGDVPPAPTETRRQRLARFLRSIRRRAVDTETLPAFVTTAISLAGSIVTILAALFQSVFGGLGRWAFAVVMLASLFGILLGLVSGLTQIIIRMRRREDHLGAAIAETVAVRDHLISNDVVPRALRRFATISHHAKEVRARVEHGQPAAQTLLELHGLLEEFARAFSLLIQVECKASIKNIRDVHYGGNVVPAAKTLARSNTIEPDDQGEFFVIANNTAFETIYYAGQNYFFGNDLRALADAGQYENQRPGWRQRYRASIVWQLKDTDGLVGFCCIDNMAADSFHEIRDINIGWLVVDAITPIVSLVDELLKSEEDRINQGGV